MHCKILHESRGRMRVHMMQHRMTNEEADLLEAYLSALPDVREAKVYERTADAVIRYRGVGAWYSDGARRQPCDASAAQDAQVHDCVGVAQAAREAQTQDCASDAQAASDAEARNRVVDALSAFDYGEQRERRSLQDGATHTTSGRALRREYEERLAGIILRRAAGRLLLPLPVRTAVTLCKSLPFLLEGLESLAHGRLEVSVLDAASITVSMLRGEYDTAGSIIFLLRIGDTMDEWTHRKSVEDLAGAMALNVDRVWLRTVEGQEALTAIDRVRTGDVVIVRTGNLIPLDGEVSDGDAMVNQASMTGEPLAVHKAAGGYVYAGSVVEEGALEIRVRQESGESRYDRIVRMIEESEKLKSSAETKAANLADRLVPWTFAATGLTYLLTRDTARAASILMVDFCCALKLSMPVAVLSAMREAGTRHVAVKGGKFMESYAQAQTICFDKTGTLTVATPRVKEVIPFGGRDADEMLRLAACLEEHYPHSLADAVVREARERGLDHEERHSNVEYVVAHGIASSVDGEKVCIGSYHFLFEDEGCRIPSGEEERFAALPGEDSRLYLSVGGELAAVLLIEDPIKETAGEAVRALRSRGFDRVVMMTGDGAHTAQAVARRVGVDEYHAAVLPEDKAEFIRREHDAGRRVVMVGDGINDSPALSAADVGIAMNSGAAVAREIADVTIATDDLYALVTLRDLSKGLMSRIHWNYKAILSFNSALILLGALGLLPSATTALLHNASTVLIGLRSMTNLLPEPDSKKLR